MKLRMLHILSAGFVTVMLGQAYSLADSRTDDRSILAKSVIESPSSNAEGVQETGNAAHALECLTGDVLEAIQSKRNFLDRKEVDLAYRQGIVEKMEARVKLDLDRVSTVNAELGSRLTTLQAAAKDDITHLIGMYEIMKPKQAAGIFESMDPEFAAGFLRGMDTDRAGLVMAHMSPSRSYAISVVIASKGAEYR